MFRKKDIILITAILIVAGVFAVFFYIHSQETGEMVCIMLEGKEYGSYSLEENRVVAVESERGYNKLVIKDYEVFMEEADCPDQYCVEHRAISKTNETIVCLPHKLVVELHVKNGEADFDSLSQ